MSAVSRVENNVAAHFLDSAEKVDRCLLHWPEETVCDVTFPFLKLFSPSDRYSPTAHLSEKPFAFIKYISNPLKNVTTISNKSGLQCLG